MKYRKNKLHFKLCKSSDTTILSLSLILYQKESELSIFDVYLTKANFTNDSQFFAHFINDLAGKSGDTVRRNLP